MPPPDPMESWEEPEIKSLDDVTPEEWDQAVKSIKEEEVEEEQLEFELSEDAKGKGPSAVNIKKID